METHIDTVKSPLENTKDLWFSVWKPQTMMTCSPKDCGSDCDLFTICGVNTLGLIIDAFGELRDQQEQVKEDMEVKRQTHTHTS